MFYMQMHIMKALTNFQKNRAGEMNTRSVKRNWKVKTAM